MLFLSKEEKEQILVCKMSKNKQQQMKLLLRSFHLNGETLGLLAQTCMTQGLNDH